MLLTYSPDNCLTHLTFVADKVSTTYCAVDADCAIALNALRTSTSEPIICYSSHNICFWCFRNIRVADYVRVCLVYICVNASNRGYLVLRICEKKNFIGS
jgi:hypothetical protein